MKPVLLKESEESKALPASRKLRALIGFAQGMEHHVETFQDYVENHLSCLAREPWDIEWLEPVPVAWPLSPHAGDQLLSLCTHSRVQAAFLILRHPFMPNQENLGIQLKRRRVFVGCVTPYTISSKISLKMLLWDVLAFFRSRGNEF